MADKSSAENAMDASTRSPPTVQEDSFETVHLADANAVKNPSPESPKQPANMEKTPPQQEIMAVDDSPADQPTTSNDAPVGDRAKNSGPEDQALKEFAATAEKVAEAAKSAVHNVEEAAKTFSKKLVVEGNSTFTKLAGGISNWWANLDPLADERVEETTPEPDSSSVIADLHSLYGLDESDALLEQFKCKVLQTYECKHNAFTPIIQMAFPVVLSVLEQHFCFCVEHRQEKYPAVVSHADVKSVERKTSGGEPLLYVALADGKHIVFKNFASETELDSALALLEHLADR